MKKFIQKTIIALSVGMIFSTAQLVKAQDTITIEVDEKTKILIFAKDQEAFERLKSLDLNNIIEEVVDERTGNEKAETITYQYEMNNNGIVRTEVVKTSHNDVLKDIEDENEEAFKDDEETRSDFAHMSNKISKKGVYWMTRFDFGLNNYLENGSFPETNNQPYALVPFQSQHVSVASMLKIRVARVGKSAAFLQTGIDLTWYNFHFRKSNYITQTDNGVVFRDYYAENNKGLKGNKLTTLYIGAPIMLKWQFYNQGQYRRTFNIGIGGYVGYLVHSYSKINADGAKQKDYSNFFLNNFRYGLEAQIGYGDLSFFAKYDLNPLFNQGRAPELNVFSFGIRL
ncbi:MAG: hypothetical protein EAZ55_01345 [Cytophagales bacterium]|nr:MAG: hypothetical protein EAZ55_01345 [Cytophagales bacterium]